MKKIIVAFLIFTIPSIYIQGQVSDVSIIKGSWINTSISEFYESNDQHACDIYYFDNDRFLPLYLSFENIEQVKITYRIEQPIFTYKINYSNVDCIFIFRGENKYRLNVLNDTLKLECNQNIISFKKVSDKYSTDVFGEYIKGIIFMKHDNYLISSFKEGLSYKDIQVNKANFKDKMMEIFRCNYVDFVQLGSFKFKNTCLPEVALYYTNSKIWTGPRVFGILIENDEINLIDRSGIKVLTLISN